MRLLCEDVTQRSDTITHLGHIPVQIGDGVLVYESAVIELIFADAAKWASSVMSPTVEATPSMAHRTLMERTPFVPKGLQILDTFTSALLQRMAAAVRSHLWHRLYSLIPLATTWPHVPERLRLIHQPNVLSIDSPLHRLIQKRQVIIAERPDRLAGLRIEVIILGRGRIAAAFSIRSPWLATGGSATT